MKTAVITGYGGPEVLHIHDTPMPQPRPGEALVAVAASTINPVDVKFRIPGTIQQVQHFPATLGWDLAGIIITAPDDSRWQPGDRVIAMHPPEPDGTGCWSQYVTIATTLLAAAPESVDLPTAATLPLAGLTAAQALNRLDVRLGERILITGAGGSVGGIAVQLATDQGIEVTGLVFRGAHVGAVRGLGAAHMSNDPNDLGAFDAIFDTAGILDHPNLLRDGGRLVTISDRNIPPTLARKAAAAKSNYVRHDPELLQHLVDRVDAGPLTLRVAQLYPLNQIRRAHEHFEKGGLLGKIVLTL